MACSSSLVFSVPFLKQKHVPFFFLLPLKEGGQHFLPSPSEPLLKQSGRHFCSLFPHALSEKRGHHLFLLVPFLKQNGQQLFPFTLCALLEIKWLARIPFFRSVQAGSELV
jgi:hypothetical protein